MGKIFVSYSHMNMNLVDLVETALNVRGIRTWRDKGQLQGGLPMETTIRKSIADPDQVEGYLLVATPQSWQSIPVQNWELATATTRHKRNNLFPIVLLVQDLEWEQIASDSVSRYGIDLTSLLAVSLPTSDQQSQSDLIPAVNQAARSLINWKVDQLNSSHAFADGRAIIDLHTRERTRFRQTPHFVIEMHESLYQSRVPTPTEWQTTILPGFSDLKRAIAEKVGTNILIEVQSKGSMSAAFALGYVFRASSGFDIAMEQNGELWSSRAIPSGGSLLQLGETRRTSGAKNVILEVQVTNSTDQAVTEFIRSQDFDYRVRKTLYFETPHGRTVRSPEDAIDIAEQVARVIRQSHDELGVDTVCHVFYAGPLALAMMIGHKLNAAGPVRVYDLSTDRRTYVPTALLQ